MREITNLNEDEIARLRLLNAKLEEAQRWIAECVDRCVADYFRSGGLHRHRHSDTLYEDFYVDAEVECVLREDHPDFDEDEDNIVATLSTTWIGTGELWPEGDNWNEFADDAAHPLKGDRHCWLFHVLYDHKLDRDWEKVLSVGGVWIDVKLVQQRHVKLK